METPHEKALTNNASKSSKPRAKKNYWTKCRKCGERMSIIEANKNWGSHEKHRN